MVAPDNSETIRCMMCGESNPADATACEYCGAPLFPASKPQPGPQAARESSTVGGVPGWLPVTQAPSTAPKTGSTPDWLPVESPPRRSPPPLPDIPAWLPAARREVAAPLPPAPEPVLPTPKAPVPEVAAPEPEIPAEPVEIPDWLGGVEAPAPEAPAPELPAAEPLEIPDWLGGVEAPAPEAPAPELPAAEPIEIPDWLGGVEAPTPEAPAPEPEKPAEPLEIPDWLGGVEAPAPEAPAPELPAAEPLEIPDWLGGVEAPAPEPEKPAEPLEIPDWLGGVEAPTPEAPTAEPELPAGEAAGLPDWLGGVEAPEAPAPELPAAEPLEIPDWLSGIEAPEAPAPEPEIPAEEPAGLPDWLGGIEAPTPEAPAPELPAAEPIEIPDWLSGVEAPAPEAPAPEPEIPAGEAAGLPDFLSGIEAPAPEALAPEPEIPAEEVAGLPDWLSGIEAPEAPAPEAPAPEPEIPAGEAAVLPDFLSGIEAPAPEAPAPEAPAPEVPAPEPEIPAEEAAGLPDWLDGIKPPTPTVAIPDVPSEPAPPPVPAGDMPDWLGDIDFGAEMDLPSIPAVEPPIGGEDLLGFTDGTMGVSPTEAGVTEDVGIDLSEMPGWMRGLAADETSPPGDLELATPQEISPELLDQIGDLRFDVVTGTPAIPPDSEPEQVGALKELAGVIRPEMIFEGETLQVGDLVDEVVVTKEQARRIELLDELLSGSKAVAVKETGPELPFTRWLTAILLLIAIAVPTLLGFRLLPAPTTRPGSVIDARARIASLPSDATVLVAFEYEPDTAAELEPLALVMLDQLATLENATVYAFSTRTTGPAMIDSAFSQAAARNEGTSNWVNLGYLAGGANGISALTFGSAAGVPSPMSFDYRGEPTGIGPTRLLDANLDLIIVLAARSEDLKPWIEQTRTRLDVPMLAAMSAGSAPMAYPYRQSGQLVAVVGGVNDAVTYRLLGGQKLSPTLAAMWNAQAAGVLVAAFLIIAGGVLAFLGARLRQQEQE